MSKHTKLGFGLFEDGHTIRMVQVLRDKTKLYLQGVDRIELDQPLYHAQDMAKAMQELADNSWEDSLRDSDKITLDDLDTEYSSPVSMNPWDAMLSAVDLKHGIIALNVNDDYLIRTTEKLSNSRAIKRFAKNSLSPEEYRLREWQSSQVTIGGISSLWLHKGPNLLLEKVQDFSNKNRMQLFYQLADANDIVLTDYYRIYHLNPEQRTMLIHLGQDHRKAYIFDDGKWQKTLPLQISQHDPEPEVIYSKLALAMDSSGEHDPERLVLCGELANQELVEYLAKQYPGTTAEMLTFTELMIPSDHVDAFTPNYLAQYAVPIALALKALHPDDPRWTPSTFLPSRIVEGQKVFKIAWHGFIVLGLIFGVTFWATIAILKSNQEYREAKTKKRELTFTLEQRRKEAAEIQKIREELEAQEKNIEVLTTVLADKNPWTEVLSILNRKLAGSATNWFVNLKTEKNRLIFNGNTTHRANIIGISEALPNSRIQKVVHNEIRNTNVWAFEISSDLPKVDWATEINKDLEALLAMQQNYGEEQATQEQEATESASLSPIKLLLPTVKDAALKTDKRGRYILPPLPQESCPNPKEELTKGAGEDVKAYRRFVSVNNRINSWDYRDAGVKFLNAYPKSELAPVVSWWLSYRLYLDKDYNLANKFLEPLLKNVDRYHPYALLLKARIEYATGGDRSQSTYQQLKNDYGRHALMKQVNSDLTLIEKGGQK